MNDIKSTKEEREEFIKKLEDKATERGLSLSEYIAVTGDDKIRGVLQRIIKGASGSQEWIELKMLQPMMPRWR